MSLLSSLTSLFEDPKKKLQREVINYYAPYTQKALASNLPVRFTNNVPEGSAGYLAFKGLSGQPVELAVKKGINDSYRQLSTLEHESVHYDQVVNAPQYSCRIAFTHKDTYKIKRIEELEAYGRQTYKYIVDYAQGNISSDDINRILQRSNFLNLLLDIYIQQPVKNTLVVLNAIKNMGEVLPPEAVLPGFYGSLGEDRDFMSRLTQDIYQQNVQHFARLETIDPSNSATVEKLKKKYGIEKFFQKNFSLEDANTLLNRDGKNYLGCFSPEMNKAFWENISYLDNTQKAQVAHLEKEAAKFEW